MHNCGVIKTIKNFLERVSATWAVTLATIVFLPFPLSPMQPFFTSLCQYRNGRQSATLNTIQLPKMEQHQPPRFLLTSSSAERKHCSWMQNLLLPQINIFPPLLLSRKSSLAWNEHCPCSISQRVTELTDTFFFSINRSDLSSSPFLFNSFLCHGARSFIPNLLGLFLLSSWQMPLSTIKYLLLEHRHRAPSSTSIL